MEYCQEHYNRYPAFVDRDIFGILDLLYQRNLSVSKSVKLYKRLRKIRGRPSKITSPLCSILEVDEEDEPDSDSDWEFDSDDETSFEITPLIFHKDKTCDQLYSKLRKSLMNFSNHKKCEFLTSH